MTIQFTPGPWHVSADGNDVENVSNAGVCSLYADETADANAHLIAAAPALYEAIRRLANTGPGSLPPGDYNEWVQGVAREALALVEAE